MKSRKAIALLLGAGGTAPVWASYSRWKIWTGSSRWTAETLGAQSTSPVRRAWKFGGSEDDEVKTGPMSSPQCKDIRKGEDAKRFSLAAVIKAMSTSCHLEIRMSINKNFFTRGLEQATRKAVASPSLEVFKMTAAEPWLMQSSVGSSPVLRWSLETFRGHFPPTFYKSMKSCKGCYGPDPGFSVHALQSPSCSRQCSGLYHTCNALAHVGCPQLPTSWRDSW